MLDVYLITVSLAYLQRQTLKVVVSVEYLIHLANETHNELYKYSSQRKNVCQILWQKLIRLSIGPSNRIGLCANHNIDGV